MRKTEKGEFRQEEIWGHLRVKTAKTTKRERGDIRKMDGSTQRTERNHRERGKRSKSTENGCWRKRGIHVAIMMIIIIETDIKTASRNSLAL